MGGGPRGMEGNRKDRELLELLSPYRVSDTAYYFPEQRITIRYIDGEWLLHTTPITKKHVWEIYSTELYFEEDYDA